MERPRRERESLPGTCRKVGHSQEVYWSTLLIKGRPQRRMGAGVVFLKTISEIRSAVVEDVSKLLDAGLHFPRWGSLSFCQSDGGFTCLPRLTPGIFGCNAAITLGFTSTGDLQ